MFRVHPLLWLIWAIIFVVLETVALLNDTPNDTLTQTIVTYVPGWAVFAGIGWFIWHFIMSYLSRMNGKGGR